MGKDFLKFCDKLPREGNLRHEHNNLPSRRTHGACRLDIDACLAAARHTVKQVPMKASLGEPCMQSGNRRCLCLRQFLDVLACCAHFITVAQCAPLMFDQQPCREEILDRRRRNALRIEFCTRIFAVFPKEGERPCLRRFT